MPIDGRQDPRVKPFFNQRLLQMLIPEEPIIGLFQNTENEKSSVRLKSRNKKKIEITKKKFN
jgi:hypothetical protein